MPPMKTVLVSMNINEKYAVHVIISIPLQPSQGQAGSAWKGDLSAPQTTANTAGGGGR